MRRRVRVGEQEKLNAKNLAKKLADRKLASAVQVLRQLLYAARPQFFPVPQRKRDVLIHTIREVRCIVDTSSQAHAPIPIDDDPLCGISEPQLHRQLEDVCKRSRLHDHKNRSASERRVYICQVATQLLSQSAPNRDKQAQAPSPAE